MAEELGDAYDEDESESRTVSKKTKKGRGKKSQLFTVNIATVKGLPIYSKWLVVLDTGANVSGMYNPELVLNKRRNRDPEGISTVNGGAFVPEWEGEFAPFPVPVMYSESFEANIVAFSDVADKADTVWYNKVMKQFEIAVDGELYVFELYNGVYVHDFSPDRIKATALFATAEENERRFSPREVKAAKDVREYMRTRGLASSSEMIRSIKSGSILNCPYTEQDVLRAHKIYGPDINALKGKTKRSKHKRVEVDTLWWKPIRAIQVLVVDLMCVCGLWFLLSISDPLGMLMVTYLPDGKKLAGVYKTLMAHIAAYRGRLFDIAVLRSDSEGAVIACKEKIEHAGVHMELASKAKHCPPIERQIQLVKERFRGISHGLPYRLFDKLVIWLVYFVVTRLNQSVFSKEPGALPPFCNFKNRKLDHNIDNRIGFGEYVQVHEDNGEFQNSMLPRTTAAISLCMYAMRLYLQTFALLDYCRHYSKATVLYL